MSDKVNHNCYTCKYIDILGSQEPCKACMALWFTGDHPKWEPKPADGLDEIDRLRAELAKQREEYDVLVEEIRNLDALTTEDHKPSDQELPYVLFRVGHTLAWGCDALANEGKLQAELAELKERYRWKPFDKRHPPKEGWYQATFYWARTGKYYVYRNAKYFDADTKKWDDEEEGITHYKPLPPAPEDNDD